MSAEPAAVQRHLKIVNLRGLHARASAKFVQTVALYDAEVSVEKDGWTVAGSSIMGLMMLGASTGTQIAVSATGPDAVPVLDALEALVAARFDEDE